MRALVLAAALALAFSGPSPAQDRKAQGMPVDAIKWGPAPPVLPKAGQMAVLSGDPATSDPFTVRLRMPAGYKIPPHRHPHRERVTVISGELRFGTGDALDEKGAEELGPGGFVDLPANTDHFAFATVETVIQISAEGPFGITYVRAADDPSRSAGSTARN